MSDLQLALIVFGIVIVVAVVLYNWWQERRLMRENKLRFDNVEDDPLLRPQQPAANEEEVFRIDEPADKPDSPLAVEATVFPAAPFAAEAESVPRQSAEEVALQATPPITRDTLAASIAGYGELPANLDEQIDLIGLLVFAKSQSASAVSAVLQPIATEGKLCQCLLQDPSGVWYNLSAQHDLPQLTAAICALQLADRRGPVSESTLLRFRESVERATDILEGTLEWRGAKKTLPYAVELDQFGMDVDVSVSLHIVPGDNGPFAGTKLRGLAEAAGLQLAADGAFHSLSEAGETRYTLISQDKRPFKPETLRTLFYRDLTFQLDVPRVANCSEVFGQMVQVARKLQLALGGQLVDDNQHPLSDADIDKIRQQIKAIQSRMIARGIPPGSATALRLFS